MTVSPMSGFPRRLIFDAMQHEPVVCNACPARNSMAHAVPEQSPLKGYCFEDIRMGMEASYSRVKE